jgi:transposase
MGKNSDLSPRKVGQIKLLLCESLLKQREIAVKLGISPQTVSVIKKKIDRGVDIASKRIGRCGRKRKTSPRTDRFIVQKALKNRRMSCRRISIGLAASGVAIARRTINDRLLERGLKAYRPRKKPRLTKAMIKARLDWARDHVEWTPEQWGKVRMMYLVAFSC